MILEILKDVYKNDRQLFYRELLGSIMLVVFIVSIYIIILIKNF